jgi:hypothetical protein
MVKISEKSVRKIHLVPQVLYKSHIFHADEKPETQKERVGVETSVVFRPSTWRRAALNFKSGV